MKRTLWTEAHDAILEKWSGKITAAKIAEMTGHCEKTVKLRQKALREAGANLPVYHHKRAGWSRRDYLLAGAAGLAVEESPW